MSNSYNNESITSLKGADRVRLRPGVIFGSDGLDGCAHSFFEILSNAIDEAREGFGTQIEVTRHTDLSLTVKDYGRGIPVEFNSKEGRYNWELVFCELYAGGKYQNNLSDTYSFSLGLNGLGACATQYSAEFMDVEIYRDEMHYTLHFEKGQNIGGLKKEPAPGHATGTTITWRPDRDVFTDIAIPVDYFETVLKKQAIVNAGISFLFFDEASQKKETYFYQNGIRDYLEELNATGNPLTGVTYWQTQATGRDREDKEEYRLKFQVAFAFNNEVNLIEYYHNSSFLEHGGAPDKAVRSAFVFAFDRYLKQNNLYKKDEKKISFNDVEDSLVLVISSFSTVTSYENQTKKSITNKFIQEAMTDYLKSQLEIYLIENSIEAEKVASQILANKRSRETAEKTRTAIRKKLTGNLDMTNRVEKFVDCRTKDVNRREIYIVEGDSALGACKLGRDAEFQAIIPVRGKILNCLKADYDKIFKNDIITDLLRVLGCGVELKTKHTNFNAFDLQQLKWSKIIICTDADVDGYQIRTLILTMLYRLTPTLIKEKKVFIAESPLYEITAGKDTFFAYSEAEKTAILSKVKGKYTIQRSKGLGENQPEMMWETTMNPATRRLIQVLPEDERATREKFELLLGDNLKGRKEHIERYGRQYIDLSDLS